MGEFVSNRPEIDKTRKKLTASLIQSTDSEVEVLMDGAKDDEPTLLIPYQYIHKAKVVYPFENNVVNKKTKGRKG